MNSQTEGIDSAIAFQSSTRLPISALNPTRATDHAEHIEATIVLVWPYSSSTKRLSLLLAENDVRLRKSHGQVRITFEGECAQEVAKTHAGIGDTIKLGLSGISWRETGSAVSTPGKKVNWDLDIRKKVLLEVRRKHEAPLFLDFKAKTPPVSEVVNQRDLPQHDLSPTKKVGPTTTSSVFRTPVRASAGTRVNTSLSPFASEDDYGSGRSRKRTKYARNSGAWRLLDDDEEDENQDEHERERASSQELPISPVSPTKDDEVKRIPNNPPDIIDLVSPTSGELIITTGASQARDEVISQAKKEEYTISYDRRGSISMGPPSVIPQPSLSNPPSQSFPPLLPDLAQPMSTPTPVLHPVPSPQLPLVSPLFTQPGISTGYFPPVLTRTDNEPTTGPSQWFTGATNVEDSNPASAISTVDHASVFVAGAEFSLPTSAIVEERSTIADDPFQSQRSIMLSQDIPSGVQIESFNTSDIRGLGDAYADIPQGYVDLDALQQEIEQSGYERLVPNEGGGDMKNTDMPEIPQAMSDGIGQHTSASTLPAWSLSQALTQETSLRDEYQVENDVVENPHADETPAPDVTRSSMVYGRLDGNDSRYEQIEERRDIRAEMANTQPSPKSPEVVEIVSDDAEDEINKSQPSQEQSQILVSRILRESSPAGSKGRSVPEDNTIVAVKNALMQREGPAIQVDTATHMEKISSLLTPVATQQSHHETHISGEYPTSVLAVLPATPIQSQPTGIIKTDVQEDSRSREADEADEADVALLKSPELPVIQDFKQTRQSANRLARRQFSSDTVGNEYFTPRRSGNAAMLDVQSPANGVRSEAIPSSPPGPQRSARTLPLEEHEQLPVHRVDQEIVQAPIDGFPQSQGSLTTPLSYYPRLRKIHEFYGHEIDILAISTAASTAATKAKSGPKDFYTSIHLADEEAEHEGREHFNTTVTAQIFRLRKNALPLCQRGNVLLLRNMKVQQQNLKPMLLSTDTSGWVVFSESEDGSLRSDVTGPPVEYGDSETQHVMHLLQWWKKTGVQQYPEQSTEPRTANPTIPPSSQSSLSSKWRPTRSQRSDRGLKIDTHKTIEKASNDPPLSSKDTNTNDLASPRLTRSRRRQNQSISNVTPTPEPEVEFAALPKATTSDEEQEANDTLTSLPAVSGRKQAEPISPTLSMRSMRSNRSTRSATNIAASQGPPMRETQAAPEGPSPPGRRRKRNRKKSESNISVQSQDQTQAQVQSHELRNGTQYTDTTEGVQTRSNAQAQAQGHRRGRSKSNSIVHELRDGVKYTD